MPERATRPLTPSWTGCSTSRNSVITSASGPRAGDQAQHAVVVEALDRGEVERERAVQLVDDQLTISSTSLRRRQPRGEPRRERAAARAGRPARRHAAMLLHALVGAVAAQRLGAALALPGARACERAWRSVRP